MERFGSYGNPMDILVSEKSDVRLGCYDLSFPHDNLICFSTGRASLCSFVSPGGCIGRWSDRVSKVKFGSVSFLFVMKRHAREFGNSLLEHQRICWFALGFRAYPCSDNPPFLACSQTLATSYYILYEVRFWVGLWIRFIHNQITIYILYNILIIYIYIQYVWCIEAVGQMASVLGKWIDVVTNPMAVLPLETVDRPPHDAPWDTPAVVPHT